MYFWMFQKFPTSHMVLYFGKASLISNTPLRNLRIVACLTKDKPCEQVTPAESADLPVIYGTVTKTTVK